MKNKEIFDFDWGENMTLAHMVTGSAANGVYFNQYNIGYTNAQGEKINDMITGGGAIATSPALYSYFMLSE